MTGRILARVLTVAIASTLALVTSDAAGFDHDYAQYAQVLREYLRPPRVDYAALKKGRAGLDAAVAAFGGPTADGGQTGVRHPSDPCPDPRLTPAFGERTPEGERGWTREQRLAFWINAYNAFTLSVIVDHYPIHTPWFTLSPRNSIRQIDGVWTKIEWRAAGRSLTLDDIEHRILRPDFKEPRVHFALNCASVGCPPLAAEPYRAATLDAQLDLAARRYLASEQGLRIERETLRVSRILEWYGEDFVARFAPDAVGKPDRVEQAIRGVVVRFGPPAAADLARTPSARVRFIGYDWSLNDVR